MSNQKTVRALTISSFMACLQEEEFIMPHDLQKPYQSAHQ